MSDELYRRLNVSSKASTDEIKKAYREMARQHHPDKGGDAEVFKGVQEAHEVLSDPDRRRMYDATGSARQDTQQHGGFPGGFPGFPGFPFGQGGFPDEIFRMFGGAGAGGSGGGRAQKGPDRHTQATIGLDAFYNGFEIHMNLRQNRKCSDCKATTQTCGDCKGSGFRPVTRQMGPMMIRAQEVCGSCKQSGVVNPISCSTCKNKRYVEVDKSLVGRVKPGMSEGEMLTFAGECSEGPEFERPGDVVIVLTLADGGGRYSWRGNDLHITHTITYAESMLGFRVVLDDHPSRQQQVFVWAGGPLIHGSVVRMEGKGMPKNGSFGDLLVKVDITAPPLVPWTAEQRAALVSVFGASGHT